MEYVFWLSVITVKQAVKDNWRIALVFALVFAAGYYLK